MHDDNNDYQIHDKHDDIDKSNQSHDNYEVSKHHSDNNNNNNNIKNNNRRIITAVCDIIHDKIPVTLYSMDISLCMFVLSAISPSDQQIGGMK